VPIGGCCARGELGVELKPGEHGSTFGGSPLVCAAALATLQGFRTEDIGANVREVGAYLKARLEELPHVVDVRGKGLMLGVDFDGPYAVEVIDRGLEAGLVLNSTGESTMRLLPPLICSKADVDLFIETIRPIIEEVA
jgi:acetylornithine/N-succinyldiaminopimelate aminotransferase